MKRLFVLTTIIAAGLFASSANAQVFVNAHVGFRLPGARICVGAAPAPVVYQAPAPVYQDEYAPAPPPVYQEGYAPAGTIVYENQFPGYAYYDYPVWRGHFRDYAYYDHYRPYFEREHRDYFRGRYFDHVRYEHEHFAHGGWGHGGGWRR